MLHSYSGKHKVSTSKRKMTALNLQEIEEDLLNECGCERKCNTILDKYDILRYRKQYHLCVMGFQQQTELLRMYRTSLFQDGREKTLHLVEGNLVCR